MFMSTATEKLLQQFKALSDPQRLRLVALCRHGELSVTELTAVLGQSQPRVSQQLKQLCAAGLLKRFRDGKRVYYRMPSTGTRAGRQLLALIPTGDAPFAEDADRLRALRGSNIAGKATDDLADTRPVAELGPDSARRQIHRALLEQTVAAPIGDLLDVGCGRGNVLKLLASRANRAIGVDIDSDARDTARAELLLAGLTNCSLRKGDMYRLPFDDASFDTIVLDDVLADARRPTSVLREASRLLRPGGRLFLLLNLGADDANTVRAKLAAWSAEAELRLAPPRMAPTENPSWLLSVATLVTTEQGNPEAA